MSKDDMDKSASIGWTNTSDEQLSFDVSNEMAFNMSVNTPEAILTITTIGEQVENEIFNKRLALMMYDAFLAKNAHMKASDYSLEIICDIDNMEKIRKELEEYDKV